MIRTKSSCPMTIVHKERRASENDQNEKSLGTTTTQVLLILHLYLLKFKQNNTVTLFKFS